MAEELLVTTTPDKPANYEVSVPGEEGLVAFSHRKEMFKYLNMKLDELPEPVDGATDEEVAQAVEGAEI